MIVEYTGLTAVLTKIGVNDKASSLASFGNMEKISSNISK